MNGAIARRAFVTLLGIAAVAPVAALAQQPTLAVIGFLGAGAPNTPAGSLAAFKDGLRSAGFVEGRNATIEYRWGNDHNDQLPALAKELVRRNVVVIAALGTTPVAVAAKAATTSIPVVFAIGANPVAAGLVDSLSRPGGNLTGTTRLTVEIAPKRLELLREIAPSIRSMALLVNPTDPLVAEAEARQAAAAAHAIGIDFHLLRASTEGDLDIVFAELAKLGAGALAISTNAFFTSRTPLIAAGAQRLRIPSIAASGEFVTNGGLMSYGGNFTESLHGAGVYVGRILKGEKPADLPVQQATKFDFLINLRTAKALGITIPPSLLARADEVIE